MLAAIFGLAGPELAAVERDFFREVDPAGFILFSRNLVDRDQIHRLTDDLRDLAGRDQLPILIDQEGGPVARLGPPAWPAFPAASLFGRLYEKAPITALAASFANGAAIGSMLSDLGINVACLPVLDLAHEGAHAVIGERSFGADPLQVASLGRACLDGLASQGVCGVVKHVPGHGRATSDSHETLPVVTAAETDLADDLIPFTALADAPIAMTAHIHFTAWTRQDRGRSVHGPEARPATFSPILIEEIIRGRIGFQGLLLSDDIGMNALEGNLDERARSALAAGCDLVLHCSGDLAESRLVAKGARPATPEARGRLARAMARPPADGPLPTLDELIARRDSLLSSA